MSSDPLRFVVIHGHFYQPPRENPWIEEIEVQDGAAPYHDWNARIHAECYGPNSASRVTTAEGRIIDILNNYRRISFNFGPTLLSWLERHAPDTYQRVLEADRETHGALAQAYGHAILPLCSPRDRRTQISWGMADFEARFGRRAIGFWLPECAVDIDTLEALAAEDIRFTVLSPASCAGWRAPGASDWIRSGVDPRRPYRVALPSGKAIGVFFYDGVIAQDMAFGGALRDRDELIGRFMGGFDGDPARKGPQLVSVATDGETFGHHRSFGDMVLAATLAKIDEERPFELLTYARYFERFPPDHEAEIVSPSSWSCAHGVERWRADCGCTTPTQPGWHQRWRQPLREALDELRDRLALLFEREAAPLLRDPWAARDAAIAIVLDRSAKNVDAFIDANASRQLDPTERSHVLKLLEMERHALLMFTSCGWFFDELSRTEGVQVLKYGMRAIQLARETSGVNLEPEFSGQLARAPANVHGDGAQVLEKLVRPAVTGLGGVLAHYAISSLFEDYPREGTLYAYRFVTGDYARRTRGQAQLAVGRVRIESLITRETFEAAFGLLHFGGHDFRCAVGGPQDISAYETMKQELLEKFDLASISDVVRAIDHHFAGDHYALGTMFLDDRRKVIGILLREIVNRYRARYERIFNENRALMRFLVDHGVAAPAIVTVAAELALTRRVTDRVAELEWDTPEYGALYEELRAQQQEAARLGVKLELSAAKAALDARLLEVATRLAAGEKRPREAASAIAAYLDVAAELGIELATWQVQNRIWAVVCASVEHPLGDEDREAVERIAERLGFDRGVLTRATAAA